MRVLLARNVPLSVTLILALALAVRLVYLTVVVGLNSPPTYDGIGYDMLAVHLLETGTYGVGWMLSPVSWSTPSGRNSSAAG